MEGDNIRALPLREVDLTNNNITRCGLIPICKQDDVLLLGLVVSTYSSSIGSIGGSNEYNDHDLLNTIIRETKEEVGNYLGKIEGYHLYNCDAIITNTTLTVIYPVAEINREFTNTSEVKGIIWITTEQLRTFREKQNITVKDVEGKRQSVSRLSTDFYKIADAVADYLDKTKDFSVRPISKRSDAPEGSMLEKMTLNRPIKHTPRHVRQSYVNWSDLLNYINLDKSFIPTLFIAYDENNVVCIASNKDTFILPRSDLNKIRDIYSGGRFRILVSLPDDNFVKGDDLSMHAYLNKSGYDNPDVFSDYIKSLRAEELTTEIKSTTVREALINEAFYLYHMEKNLYKHVRKTGLFFNRQKWEFLNILSEINFFMLDNPSITCINLMRKFDNSTQLLYMSAILDTLSYHNLYLKPLVKISPPPGFNK